MSRSTAGGEINPSVHLTEKEAVAMGLIEAKPEKPAKVKRAASFSEASRGDTSDVLGNALWRQESTETQVDKWREEQESKEVGKPPSKTAVSKAIGKRKWTPARQATQAKKATVKKTKVRKHKKLGSKRRQKQKERHYRRAAIHGVDNALRHIAASPSERRASIKRKTALH